MARPRLLTLIVAVATTVLSSGCLGTGSSETDRPEPRPTPIQNVQVSALSLVRAPFCELIPREMVARTVGSPAFGRRAAHLTSWRNGDVTTFTQPAGSTGAPVKDISHEFGCRWSGRTATAEAWVFAQPVSPPMARTVVRQDRPADKQERQSCREEATRFGDPALAYDCTLPTGQHQVRYAGLFGGPEGNTWLTCQLTGGSATLIEDTQKWCVEVANALNTRKR